MIEIEHVESALKLVASRVGDSIASGAVIDSAAFPPGLHTAPFAEPLFDVIALAQHRARPLSKATREFARLAEDTIRELGVVESVVELRRREDEAHRTGTPIATEYRYEDLVD